MHGDEFCTGTAQLRRCVKGWGVRRDGVCTGMGFYTAGWGLHEDGVCTGVCTGTGVRRDGGGTGTGGHGRAMAGVCPRPWPRRACEGGLWAAGW